MAIRNIRTIGDPVLNKKCKEVKEMTPRIQELIDDMFDTMYEANGVGLAAPQVGILKRIVVCRRGTDHNRIRQDSTGGILYRSGRLYLHSV